MAVRRPPPTPVVDSEFPAHLCRGAVTVEDFVAPSERPPINWPGSPYLWREIRALRRWQAAVTAWGRAGRLSVQDLRRAGYWPTTPPPFARGFNALRPDPGNRSGAKCPTGRPGA